MPLSTTWALPHSGDKESVGPNKETQGDADAGGSADKERKSSRDREPHDTGQKSIVVDEAAEGGTLG